MFGNVSCYSLHKYFGDNQYAFFKTHNSQEFGRRFPIHSYGDIFNFGSATDPACLQPEKLFTFLSSFNPFFTFQPLSFQLFQIFSFSAFSAFSNIQLYVLREKLFSYQNVPQSIQPIIFQPFCIFGFWKIQLFLQILDHSFLWFYAFPAVHSVDFRNHVSRQHSHCIFAGNAIFLLSSTYHSSVLLIYHS